MGYVCSLACLIRVPSPYCVSPSSTSSITHIEHMHHTSPASPCALLHATHHFVPHLNDSIMEADTPVGISCNNIYCGERRWAAQLQGRRRRGRCVQRAGSRHIAGHRTGEIRAGDAACAVRDAADPYPCLLLYLTCRTGC